jgi:hypothetical protein
MVKLSTKLVGGAFLLGAALASGCGHTGEKYNDLADQCWPERYAQESRKLVHANIEPQVQNGHILDQTIWNEHFDRGSEKLNASGMDKLDQLARRRPAPDTKIFLQTTRDLNYDAAKAEEYVTKRSELDGKRIAAIQKYLNTTTSGRGLSFEVAVHDPSVPGIDGAAPRLVVPNPRTRAGLGAGTGGTGAANGQGGAPQGGGNTAPPSGGMGSSGNPSGM